MIIQFIIPFSTFETFHHLKEKGQIAESDHSSAASPVLSSYSGKRGPPSGKTEDRPRGKAGTIANSEAWALHCLWYRQMEPDFFGFMVFLDEEWVADFMKVNAKERPAFLTCTMQVSSSLAVLACLIFVE